MTALGLVLFCAYDLIIVLRQTPESAFIMDDLLMHLTLVPGGSSSPHAGRPGWCSGCCFSTSSWRRGWWRSASPQPARTSLASKVTWVRPDRRRSSAPFPDVERRTNASPACEHPMTLEVEGRQRQQREEGRTHQWADGRCGDSASPP